MIFVERELDLAQGAGDGVVEAIESDPDPSTGTHWEMGVQWHPEKMDETPSARLFEAFVSVCFEGGTR